MLQDFKNFLLRGNVVELAVAIVIGVAFGALVTSFVENLITPLIAIPGTTDFSNLDFSISDSTFRYGLFLNALVAFVMIAAAVFFFVVRPIGSYMAKQKAKEEATTRECPECLSEVPKAARRCSHCTAELVAVA